MHYAVPGVRDRQKGNCRRDEEAAALVVITLSEPGRQNESCYITIREILTTMTKKIRLK